MKRQDVMAAKLSRVSYVSWFLKLLVIPTGLISAKLMAEVAKQASAGKVQVVLLYGAGFLAVILGMKLFETAMSIRYQKSASKAAQSCKMDVYQQFLDSPLKALYATEHGEAIERLNDDFKTKTELWLNVRPEFGSGILTAIAYIIFLALQSPLAAAVLTGLSLLQIFPPLIVKKFMQVNYENCRDIEARITNFTMEGCRGFMTIKLYQLKEWWLGKLKAMHRQYAKIGSASIYTAQAEGAMETLMTNILQYGTYALMGLFVLLSLITLDVAIQAIALSSGLYAAVKTVFSVIPKFAVARVAEKRLAVWQQPKVAGTEMIPAEQVDIQDVSYGYGEKAILQKASASFPGGRIHVIKGENGIGKSTLFKLMVGELGLKKGNVSVGGVAAEKLSEKNFPEKILYIPQEDASFHLTGKEFYQMAMPNQWQRGMEAASAYGLSEKALCQTKIHELSGGERKKVFLALAMAIDPAVLLLDEPTNSLDEDSKRILHDYLEQRKGNTLIITHDATMEFAQEDSYRMMNGGIYSEKRSAN